MFARASEFAETSALHVSVIVLESVDEMCVKRDEVDRENSEVVSQLLTSMDGLRKTTRVLVIATSVHSYLLDEALRRAGRFDKEFELRAPTRVERMAILRYYWRVYGLDDDVCVEALSYLTRGFSGADLELFVSKCVSDVLRVNGELGVSDVLRVLESVTPTVMKSEESVSGISWEEIGGMDEVKSELRRCVEWPMKYEAEFRRFGLGAPHGILLYGPPGCAKTTLARALACEAHTSFWTMNTSQIFSPYVGESEVCVVVCVEK